MRDNDIFFLTAVLIICSVLFIIPNLSTNSADYKSVIRTLKSTDIKKRKTYRSSDAFLKGPYEYSLILIMEDGTQLEISDDYSEYWQNLQNKSNIGKKVKIYINHTGYYTTNPMQIDIDNEIMYTSKGSLKWKYFLLLVTTGLTIYSGIKIRKYIL